MAIALLSLEQAKRQLKPSDDYDDEAIMEKVEEASAIVLDYLKGRANSGVVITSSSVANPSVITTSSAHTFSNGATVVISGHVDSVPNLNASWTISNVLGDSFTIPVAVTTAGSGGIAWVEWSESTVPWHVRAAVKLVLTHLYEHPGDDMSDDEKLWDALRRLLERARDPALA